MLLKIRLTRFFGTARIDYKNWLKTTDCLSKERPKILHKDNQEYRAYRKKVFFPYNLKIISLR